MLAEMLRIKAIPASYVPPKDIRQLRDLTSHRSSLIAESMTMKNKIHAELAMKGTKPPAEVRSSFSKKFIIWLRSLGNSMIDKDFCNKASSNSCSN
jgi:transposase